MTRLLVWCELDASTILADQRRRRESTRPSTTSSSTALNDFDWQLARNEKGSWREPSGFRHMFGVRCSKTITPTMHSSNLSSAGGSEKNIDTPATLPGYSIKQSKGGDGQGSERVDRIEQDPKLKHHIRANLPSSLTHPAGSAWRRW